MSSTTWCSAWRCRRPPGETLEIGGPDIVSYETLLRVMAEERGLPRRIIIPVPVLTPSLSSLWIHLVTPVSARMARPLAEGLRNRVVVTDDKAAGCCRRRCSARGSRSASRSTPKLAPMSRAPGRRRDRCLAIRTGPAATCSRIRAKYALPPRRTTYSRCWRGSAAGTAGFATTRCGGCADCSIVSPADPAGNAAGAIRRGWRGASRSTSGASPSCNRDGG